MGKTAKSKKNGTVNGKIGLEKNKSEGEFNSAEYIIAYKEMINRYINHGTEDQKMVAKLIRNFNNGEELNDMENSYDQFITAIYLEGQYMLRGNGIDNYLKSECSRVISKLKEDFKIDKNMTLKLFAYGFFKEDILIIKDIQKNDWQYIDMEGGKDIYITERFIDGIKEIFERDENKVEIYLKESALKKAYLISIKTISEKYRDSLSELDKELQKTKDELSKYKMDIVTIVSLVVGVAPFLTTNLQMINSNIEIDKLLVVNGILIFVVGMMFFLINKVLNKNSDNKSGLWFFIFMILGVGLIFLG